MSKVQLPGSIIFDSQIKLHTGTEKKDVSLAREFKYHMEGEQLSDDIKQDAATTTAHSKRLISLLKNEKF